MKYLLTLIVLLIVVVSCNKVKLTCDQQPHQLKCPGHEGHGHE